MSNPTQSSAVDYEELERRTRAIRDAANMGPYIPDELKARLEAGLSDEMRTAVLELQIIAIKFGRALERRDLTQPRIELMPSHSRQAGKSRVASELALKLVDRAGQKLSQDLAAPEEDKSVDILIAPGHIDFTKKH
jgi:hypothetical protein